ncbi:carboxypeptidase B-like [Lingula anatina]|uniref:Carboxypeptidase B-like n=1 Tax=Lingula anatina TaxID=7574 RepID=A0A1S3IS57_LINAN|nr:carboxypeptidase B-like [Lingula anatina]|eukprot:XP_013401045.1 carboxypeptidase B-like [Lingula anatina]
MTIMKANCIFTSLFVLLLGCESLGRIPERVRYDGHQVIRVTPHTDEQVRALRLLKDNVFVNKVDFWRPPTGVNRAVDIQIPPDYIKVLKGALNALDFKPEVIIKDLQAKIEDELLYNLKQNATDEFDYGKYHSLDEVEEWLKSLQETYPKLVTLIPLGKSFEGRMINAIKISSEHSTGKLSFWMDGGIHAREWISPATVIYMTGQLLSQYGSDPDVTELVNVIDWYLLPVFNVDGYVYTWEKDRMWRKTRSTHPGTSCVGVDPNRNWDWHWCEAGASRNPCSDSYCGPKAFSEVELQHVTNFLAAHNDTLKCYINFHSYSELWMTPWGYTHTLPPDYQLQNKVAAAAVEALASINGVKYEHGSIANIIYPASGSSADWTYGDLGIKLSYGVELRDKGRHGFILPTDQIIPSGKETFAAVKSIGKFIINNPV